jgi:hypothetical protein
MQGLLLLRLGLLLGGQLLLLLPQLAKGRLVFFVKATVVVYSRDKGGMREQRERGENGERQRERRENGERTEREQRENRGNGERTERTERDTRSVTQRGEQPETQPGED